MEWARGLTDTDDHLLSLVVWLECCQRLGYFPKLAEIPVQVVGHMRDELGLHEDTRIAKVADRSLRHHKSLVRTRLGLVDDQAHARKVAEEAIRGAVQVKDNPADLINVALEELVRAGCELPASSTARSSGTCPQPQTRASPQFRTLDLSAGPWHDQSLELFSGRR
jgi:hypothetical protein